MAQHDYVIANGTGAAVRSDLNNGLAAIVSNNSGATAPATTYAYQWWADTTTGLLKLRNSANSAWITLFQLDGEWNTLPIENGTAAAPSIYFKDSGTDTGFYSPGADQIGISTGGTGRITVDASGRLLVGTSTTEGFGAKLQIRDDGGLNCEMFRSVASASGPTLALNKSRGSAGSPTVVSSGDVLSYIAGKGYDGAAYQEAATIKVEVDGTPGTNDMPGRLVFSTTKDGAASPTERMRISNTGMALLYSEGGQVLNLATSKASGTTDFLLVGTSGATGIETGTNRIFIYSNGNIQNSNNSYGSISDSKLKENIVNAGSQWADLKALRVRNYNLKEGNGNKHIGLIAQEVEPISPGLVYETPDRDAEGNDLGTTTKAVQYSVLYMKAVKALQEAMERIETLEASNADMLARLTALEAA